MRDATRCRTAYGSTLNILCFCEMMKLMSEGYPAISSAVVFAVATRFLLAALPEGGKMPESF